MGETYHASSGQADLPPWPPTEYGTWILHGLDYQVQHLWLWDGSATIDLGQFEYLLAERWAGANVPPPVPHIASLNPVFGPVGELADCIS